MPRTYHSVNLSEEQQEFIRLLDDYEVDVFSISKVEKLVHKKIPKLNEIIENLISKSHK